MGFDTDCRRCERLAAFLDEVRGQFPDYFSRPVPSFGDPAAHVLIVGLAPGKHGANATGTSVYRRSCRHHVVPDALRVWVFESSDQHQRR